MSFGETLVFERHHSKKGAPGCGIYLMAPRKMHLRLFAEQLKHVCKALNNSPYEKNMHALELNFPARIYEKERAAATMLVQICKKNGVVPIIRRDVGLCIETGADGVMLEDAAQILEAREVLGNSAIIGLDCGNSRAIAELALDAGMDYVSFGAFFARKNQKNQAALLLLEWWSTKTALPAVAHGKNTTNEVIAMVRSGADFIGAGSWVWNHKEGPARAIYWLQEAIEHGLFKPATN